MPTDDQLILTGVTISRMLVLASSLPRGDAPTEDERAKYIARLEEVNARIWGNRPRNGRMTFADLRLMFEGACKLALEIMEEQS